MATMTDPVLAITNRTDTTVRLTVSYTLTPSEIEKLAGTVFSEDIQVIGNDLGTANDRVISTFPSESFRATDSSSIIERIRTRDVSKATLNEDAGFTGRGSEQADEILARITITYAANAPTSPTLPAPKDSNQVQGAWK